MAKKNKKKKTQLEKGGVIKHIIVPCLLVLIASNIFLFWYNNNQNATYEGIAYIQSFIGSSGELNDYQNKIGMRNPEEDIKWFKTEDEIRIEFGRIHLTWEPEKFYEQENLDLLSTIGITTKIKKNKDGVSTLYLYYHGEQLERWVK